MAPSAAPPESTPDPWELEIVAKIRAGRGGDAKSAKAAEAAWTALLERYQDRLYGVCLRMIRDPDTARDLTQDTLVRVIHGFDSFDARARLSTWMTRIAMNVCLSHMRKQKIRRHPSLDAPQGGRGQGDSDGQTALVNGLAQDREPDASRRVEQEDARNTILRALEAVDPDHRAVLVLRDVRGLDYQEIADVLEVPVGTVKSRLFRARAALRDAVEKQGGAPADMERRKPE